MFGHPLTDPSTLDDPSDFSLSKYINKNNNKELRKDDYFSLQNKQCFVLKWYCDQKNTFIFSSDFKTLFTKQSPREILGLNFEKTVYLNFNFPIYWSAIITPERIQ